MDDKATGWHLDKKVPITLIIVLLAYGVSGLWIVADMKKDIEILKTQYIMQRDRDERQDRDMTEGLSRLRESLRAMDGKLDRLIERKP